MRACSSQAQRGREDHPRLRGDSTKHGLLELYVLGRIRALININKQQYIDNRWRNDVYVMDTDGARIFEFDK